MRVCVDASIANACMGDERVEADVRKQEADGEAVDGTNDSSDDRDDG